MRRPPIRSTCFAALRSCTERAAFALGAAVVLASGCGELDKRPPPQTGPPLLVLVYHGTSNERPLIEAKLHARVDDYRAAPNLLSAPLQRGQMTSILPPTPGDSYLTVIRKKLSLPVSDLIALTTAEPLPLRAGRHEVWVFDESFRIFDPGDNVDAGPD